MELLFEFIMEIVFEGAVDSLGNRKIPKVIRVLLFLFVLAIFVIAVSACFIVAFVAYKNEGNIFTSGICLVLGCFFLLFGIKRVREYQKHRINKHT